MTRTSDIDLIIIGRNDSENLHSITKSRIHELNKFNKVIYIDSQSTDDSISIAKSFDFETISITQANILCASLGRHIGTILSTNKFLLFIDSDMDFLSTQKLPEIINENINDTSIAGYTGRTTDIFPNGTTKERFRAKRNKSDARFFGGLLLIRRSDLIEAGNWNPGVSANEEIELYARLKQKKMRILYDNRIHCKHYTYHQSQLQLLINAYIPTSLRSAKHYGSFGIALKESIQAGASRKLISISPEPLATTATFLIIAILLSFHQLGLSLLLAIAFSIWIRSRRSLKYLLIAPSTPLHLVVGLFRKSKNNFAYSKQ